MSVIAWDGTTLAADRQGTRSSGLVTQVEKICMLENKTLLGGVGNHAECATLFQWYQDGADPKQWPEFQSGVDGYNTLIVVSPSGVVTEYNHLPIARTVQGNITWGEGGDLAMGAMAAGMDAVMAVEIACNLNAHCGLGVTHFTF